MKPPCFSRTVVAGVEQLSTVGAERFTRETRPQLHLPEIYSARPWESVAVIRGMRVFQCADEGVLEDRGRGKKGLAKEESDRIL